MVVAIGECGLDYHYDHSPRPVQRDAFALQVELAHRHGLALVVHTREAWDDTVDILTAVGVPERTVVHCFTGGPGRGPPVPRPRGLALVQRRGHLQERAPTSARPPPSARWTACWWRPTRRSSTPVPHRGTLNEPSRVPLVGAAIAQVKGIKTAQVAEVSTRNARAVFTSGPLDGRQPPEAPAAVRV